MSKNIKFIAYTIEAEKDSYNIEAIMKRICKDATPEEATFTDVASLTRALKRYIPEGVTNVSKFLNIYPLSNHMLNIENKNNGKKNINIDIVVEYMELSDKIVLTSMYYNDEESLECSVDKDLRIQF